METKKIIPIRRIVVFKKNILPKLKYLNLILPNLAMIFSPKFDKALFNYLFGSNIHRK